MQFEITILGANNQPDLSGTQIRIGKIASGQPAREWRIYQKGDLKAVYDSALSYATFVYNEFESFVGRQLFSDYVNGHTGQPFSTGLELQSFVIANFRKPGSAIPTPTPVPAAGTGLTLPEILDGVKNYFYENGTPVKYDDGNTGFMGITGSHSDNSARTEFK